MIEIGVFEMADNKEELFTKRMSKILNGEEFTMETETVLPVPRTSLKKGTCWSLHLRWT